MSVERDREEVGKGRTAGSVERRRSDRHGPRRASVGEAEREDHLLQLIGGEVRVVDEDGVVRRATGAEEGGVRLCEGAGESVEENWGRKRDERR